MPAMPERTAFQNWLERLAWNIKPTPKGVRVDLTLYIYPDGHGNLFFQNPETGKLDDANQPVDNIDEAVAALQAVWERATTHPK